MLDTSPAEIFVTPTRPVQRHLGPDRLGDSGIGTPEARLMSSAKPGKRVLARKLMDSFDCSPIYSPNTSALEGFTSDHSLVDSVIKGTDGPVRKHSRQQLNIAQSTTPPNARMEQLCLHDDTPETTKNITNRTTAQSIPTLQQTSSNKADEESDEDFVLHSVFNKNRDQTSCSQEENDENEGFKVPSRFNKHEQASPNKDDNEGFILRKSKSKKLLPCPANFNPFTPEGSARKISVQNGTERSNYRQRVSISDVTTKRYFQEFDQLEVLGSGSFGQVYKVKHRLDGMYYAIKCTKKNISENPTDTVLREIYGQAVLGLHPNIVRYYSTWIENRCLYIQTEYCDGGCVAALLNVRRAANTCLIEKELRLMLKHVAQGLRYMHGRELVHMDIKPENILMCLDTQFIGLNTEAFPTLLLDDVDRVAPLVIYKIGDFGMVSTPKFHHGEDGDCRYMAPEQFNDSRQDLYKVDIFSLAMGIFDAGSVVPIPKGDRWQATKIDKWNEDVSGFWARCTECFKKLLKLMIVEDPLDRISAAQILDHAYFAEGKAKFNQDLENKVADLEKQLADMREQLKQMEEAKKVVTKSDVQPVRRVTRASSRRINKGVGQKRESSDSSDVEDCAPQRKSQRLVGSNTRRA